MGFVAGVSAFALEGGICWGYHQAAIGCDTEIQRREGAKKSKKPERVFLLYVFELS